MSAGNLLPRGALVTGAGGGLGRTFVAEFASQDWLVCAACHRFNFQKSRQRLTGATPRDDDGANPQRDGSVARALDLMPRCDAPAGR
ncbi:MAG: hypothetical protein HY043_13825 [Verrucomicrobia bacterium]|nr:hypothetical protein [Verrucomicrobiota bacterium]